MELWTEVRRRVLTGQLSQRAACREYALGWWTLKKILAHGPAARRLAEGAEDRDRHPIDQVLFDGGHLLLRAGVPMLP